MLPNGADLEGEAPRRIARRFLGNLRTRGRVMVPCGGETCADMVLFGQAGVFAAILGPSTAAFRATRRLAVTVQGQYFLPDNPLKPLFHRRPHARLAA